MNPAPKTLWLQFFGDDPADFVGVVDDGAVTWSRERVFDGDMEYVAAAAVRQELRGHRCSELCGDNGLIAATMRALDHGEQVREAVETLRDSKGRHNTAEAYRRLMALFELQPPNTAPAPCPGKGEGRGTLSDSAPSIGSGARART